MGKYNTGSCCLQLKGGGDRLNGLPLLAAGRADVASADNCTGTSRACRRGFCPETRGSGGRWLRSMAREGPGSLAGQEVASWQTGAALGSSPCSLGDGTWDFLCSVRGSPLPEARAGVAGGFWETVSGVGWGVDPMLPEGTGRGKPCGLEATLRVGGRGQRLRTSSCPHKSPEPPVGRRLPQSPHLLQHVHCWQHTGSQSQSPGMASRRHGPLRSQPWDLSHPTETLPPALSQHPLLLLIYTHCQAMKGSPLDICVSAEIRAPH